MKHLLIFISLMLLTSEISFTQEHNIHPVIYIFNPNDDAAQNIDAAITKAAKTHKHILILVGGDWSFWSRTYNAILKDGQIKKCMDEKYVLVRVNFSPENRNEAILSKYSCPKDQGYPIVIILDEKGNKLYTGNTDKYQLVDKWPSGYVFRGYDKDGVLKLLTGWSDHPEKIKKVH